MGAYSGSAWGVWGAMCAHSGSARCMGSAMNAYSGSARGIGGSWARTLDLPGASGAPRADVGRVGSGTSQHRPQDCGLLPLAARLRALGFARPPRAPAARLAAPLAPAVRAFSAVLGSVL
eukprot:gene12962-biopygen6999